MTGTKVKLHKDGPINNWTYPTNSELPTEVIQVKMNETWFITTGKGTTIHQIKFTRFTKNMVFIKDMTKVGSRAKPYLHSQIFIIEKGGIGS